MLTATTYKNIERTVTGTVNVKNSDVILNCNTSTIACTVNLQDYVEGAWNSIYKLYVNDTSGNAAVKNITIVAPIGYTINNESSLIINVNGGCAIVRIAADNKYSAELNYCCALSKDMSYYAVSADASRTITIPENNTQIELTDLLLTIGAETTSGENYLINANISGIQFSISPSLDNGSLILKSVITNSIDVLQEQSSQQIIILSGYTSVGTLTSVSFNWIPIVKLKTGWKIKTYLNVQSSSNNVEVIIRNGQTSMSQVTALRLKLL